MSDDVSKFSPELIDERRAHRVLISTLFVAGIIAMVDQSATIMALPAIRDVYDTGKAELIWLQVATTLLGASIAIQAGAVGDRLGRGRVIAAGAAIYIVGALVSAFAFGPPDSEIGPVLLITGRLLCGVGDSIFVVLALALIASMAPAKRTPRVVARWSTLTIGASAVAPFISGVIVDNLGWRFVFGLPIIPVAAIAVVLLKLRPEFHRTAGQTVNWFAGTLLALALVSLIAATTQLEEGSKAATRSAIMLVIASVFLGWFIVVEIRSSHPLVHWSALTAPGVFPALLSRALVALMYSGTVFEVSLLLLNGLDYSPTQVGAISLALAGASIVMSSLSTRVCAYIGVARAAALGCAGLSLGLGWLSTITPSSGTVAVSAGLTAFGAGGGLLTATIGAAILTPLSQKIPGQGAGIFSFAAVVPGMLGLSAIGIAVARVVEQRWTARTAGPCGSDPEVLSDLSSGAFMDIADTCGPDSATAAREIYTTGVTDVLEVIAVVLGLVAVGILWALRNAKANGSVT